MYTSDELYQAALDDFKETNMENGIKVLVFGSIISWVGTFCLYGFGELIHTNCMMCEDMKEIKRAVVYVGTNRTHNANEDYSAQNNLPGISRKDLQTIMMKRINGEITDEEFEVMVAPYKNEEKRDLE